MSFWEEQKGTPRPPTSTSSQSTSQPSLQFPPPNATTTKTQLEGIYTTKAGKFRVYVRRNGTQHCVGTYLSIEEAYDAKLQFIETGIKKPSSSKSRGRQALETPDETITKYLTSNEEYDILLQEGP